MKGLLLVATVSTIFLQLAYPVKANTDLTIVEGATGSDVTEASIIKIRRSQIFSDDYKFLDRLAYVESEFGLSNETANDGGIWQVNEIYLQQSKADRLNSLHNQINSTFGIFWPNVTYGDLLKPLYSGLAARLYLASLATPIPEQSEDQATYWVDNYNQRDYTEEVFIVKIRELEEMQRECTGKLDVELVLDASGSIGAENFEFEREFTISLLSTFNLTNTRIGCISFSDPTTIVFPLENSLTLDQMTSAIRGITYPSGGTDTNEAIRQAVLNIQAASARPGIPQVMVVLTDGQSTTGVGNIQLAKQASVISFAVGVGPGAVPAELTLIAQDDPNHVFALSNFDALTEFFQRLKEETCALPQKPGFNSTTADEVEGRERRFYEYPLGPAGVTVQVNALLGQVDGYYSRTIENPTSALNDGPLGSSTFISNPNGATKVHLTVEGVQPNNLYTVTVYERDVTTSFQI